MIYERWTYLDDYNNDIRSLYIEFGINQCNPYSGVGTSWYAMPGYVEPICYKDDDIYSIWIRGGAFNTFPQHIIKPGGRYVLYVNAAAKSGSTGISWGFTDPLNDDDVQGSANIDSNYHDLEVQDEMKVIFNPQTTKFIIECESCLVHKLQFMLMPLYHRVTQRILVDNVTGETSTYLYEYEEPATNDANHSEVVAAGTSNLYTSPFRQYRGNSVVHVKNPG